MSWFLNKIQFKKLKEYRKNENFKFTDNNWLLNSILLKWNILKYININKSFIWKINKLKLQIIRLNEINLLKS